MKRKWKFRIETDGQYSESILVDANGRHDEDARFIGTEAEASQEATRRCFAWEDRIGETPACIEYISCGVANAQSHDSASSPIASNGLVDGKD